MVFESHFQASSVSFSVVVFATHPRPVGSTWYDNMFHQEASWRLAFFRGNEQTHRVLGLSQALTITLQHVSSTNLITGRERFRIECVCCATVMERGSRVTFQRWLQMEEKMFDVEMLSLVDLHFAHHASLRQRSYLHRALAGTQRRCCCLGSKPLYEYKASIASIEWRPADIDIFVLEESVLDDLCTDYAVHVCEPLGLRMVRCGRNWLCSLNEVEAKDPVSEVLIDTTIGRNQVRRIVVQALDSLLQKVSSDELSEDFEELFTTKFHIPHSSGVRPYTVIKSVRLIPESRSDSYVPAVLLPINIIVVRPDRCVPCECYTDLASFRDLVAAGFDLLHCCIALSVTSELTFVTMESQEGAYALARSSKLQWVNVFTGTEYSTVHRIQKYIRRGFRW